MRMRIRSKVKFDEFTLSDEYVQEFDEKENVFGRVLIYHERMRKVFPGCEFELVSAKEVKE